MWYVCRGSLRVDKSEYGLAIADFSETLRFDPQEEVALACRGSVWLVKQEFDKALADFNEAVRLDPRFWVAYVNRGQAWSGKKELGVTTAFHRLADRAECYSSML